MVSGSAEAESKLIKDGRMVLNVGSIPTRSFSIGQLNNQSTDIFIITHVIRKELEQ